MQPDRDPRRPRRLPRCKLHAGRTNIVFGVGNPDARLMFVGEGPGADEDEQGEPFVGRAGQLLTQIIKAMGLAREDVYIANVVKCRPPGNRNPEPDEIEACSPFLQAQIAAIGPTVIVALGKFAAQTLLQTETPISRLRGQFHSLGGVAVMPTFHPSYLLRNPAAKREVWEDMKMVMKKLTTDRLTIADWRVPPDVRLRRRPGSSPAAPDVSRAAGDAPPRTGRAGAGAAGHTHGDRPGRLDRCRARSKATSRM